MDDFFHFLLNSVHSIFKNKYLLLYSGKIMKFFISGRGSLSRKLLPGLEQLRLPLCSLTHETVFSGGQTSQDHQPKRDQNGKPTARQQAAQPSLFQNSEETAYRFSCTPHFMSVPSRKNLLPSLCFSWLVRDPLTPKLGLDAAASEDARTLRG